jgi:RNA polymerase sigma-70 factor, ECF subfamily
MSNEQTSERQELKDATMDLVERAQAGDADAYEALYHENVGRIYALCLRMSRNKTVAEDLTQEAFIRAWKKLNSFRGDSAFSTWLHRLTVNVVLTALKTQSRKQEKVFTTDDLVPFERPTSQNKPGLGMDLEAAIAQLPNRAREVFILYEVEGYKHDEIASMLGIASGTTKAQLHRARNMLREVLA